MTAIGLERQGLERQGSRLPLWDAPRLVAVLSAVAAGIHLAVMPEHLEHWWAYGAFFIGCAIAQALFAVLVYRWPRPGILMAGLVGNLGVVLLWVWSRAFGLPVGPPVLDFTAGRGDPALGGYGSHASGQLEPVGMFDVSATLLELVIIIALVSLLAPAIRRKAVNVLFGLAIVLWVLRFVGPTV